MHDHRIMRIVFAVLVVIGGSNGLSVADEQADKLQDDKANDQVVEVEQDSKELSVPPLDHVVYPENRPEWLGNPVQQSDNVATFVVVSGPCETREESQRELRLMRQAAFATFIKSVVGTFGSAGFYQVSDERFDQELTLRRYSGELEVGGTTHYEDAVEIQITQSERDAMLEAWKNIEVTRRMATLGVATVGGFIALVVSSTVFGAAIRRREQKAGLASESV